MVPPVGAVREASLRRCPWAETWVRSDPGLGSSGGHGPRWREQEEPGVWIRNELGVSSLAAGFFCRSLIPGDVLIPSTTSYGIEVESEFVERELSPQQVVISTCFIYLFICFFVWLHHGLSTPRDKSLVHSWLLSTAPGFVGINRHLWNEWTSLYQVLAEFGAGDSGWAGWTKSLCFCWSQSGRS